MDEHDRMIVLDTTRLSKSSDTDVSFVNSGDGEIYIKIHRADMVTALLVDEKTFFVLRKAFNSISAFRMETTS